MLSDFFDTMGTVIGVAGQGGLLDREGALPGVGRVLLVDSVAAAAGGPVLRPPPTPPTSSRPRASAKAPAPAWPA